MKATKVIVTTTDGTTFSGTTDYIGCATISVNAPLLNSAELVTLYKHDATVRQCSDHWQVQIAKKHITVVQFFDE